MRGRVRGGGRHHRHQGITPARAGKSSFRVVKLGRAADHPRACGEEEIFCASIWLSAGSPPRVRGRVSNKDAYDKGNRITPARAGKRPGLLGKGAAPWDHPRACGEERWQPFSACRLLGSPPRVRGRAETCCTWWNLPRITPARAGKSPQKSFGGTAARDHPRACGEERRIPCHCRCGSGSPPRVRGRANGTLRLSTTAGITPARAGKSFKLEDDFDLDQDHPRACGEEFEEEGDGTKGSPPRVRGRVGT